MSNLRSASSYRRTLGLGGGLVVAGVLLAACGSGSSSGGGGSSATTSTGGSAAAGGSSAGVTIKTASGPLGTYLTNAAGITLYDFAADKGTTSECNGSCATYWPPVIASGTPAVSGNAKANLLGTTKRADGSMQVTYGGHPLYTYAADSAAGDTKGQGLNLSGGLWWVVAPDGTSVKGGAGTSTSSSAAKGHGY